MKIYKSQEEFKTEIKDGRFYSEESIDITAFDLDVEADIEVKGNIKAGNIKARNIDALGEIKAWDINAKDIKATDINAWNVNYYAVAFAYNNIKVKSIKGNRKNARHFVLDGELKVEDEK